MKRNEIPQNKKPANQPTQSDGSLFDVFLKGAHSVENAVSRLLLCECFDDIFRKFGSYAAEEEGRRRGEAVMPMIVTFCEVVAVVEGQKKNRRKRGGEHISCVFVFGLWLRRKGRVADLLTN